MNIYISCHSTDQVSADMKFCLCEVMNVLQESTQSIICATIFLLVFICQLCKNILMINVTLPPALISIKTNALIVSLAAPFQFNGRDERLFVAHLPFSGEQLDREVRS